MNPTFSFLFHQNGIQINSFRSLWLDPTTPPDFSLFSYLCVVCVCMRRWPWLKHTNSNRVRLKWRWTFCWEGKLEIKISCKRIHSVGMAFDIHTHAHKMCQSLLYINWPSLRHHKIKWLLLVVSNQSICHTDLSRNGCVLWVRIICFDVIASDDNDGDALSPSKCFAS